MKYTPCKPTIQDEIGLIADHHKRFNDLGRYFYFHEKEEIWQAYPKFHTPPLYSKFCRVEFAKTEIERHDIDHNTMQTKGISELFFLPKIKERFSEQFLENAILPGNGGLPIVPDILLFDEDLSFYLDIEIDEPYVWNKNIETHFIGADTERDFQILFANWFLIRFTEQQIVQFPDRCLRQIEHALSCIRSMIERRVEIFFEKDLLISELAWTKSDCTKMMINDKRSEYLSTITSTQSQISKSMSNVQGAELLIDQWFSIPELWRKAIIESVFSEEFSYQLCININQAKYLLTLNEFDFWGAKQNSINRNLNRISFQLESVNGIDLLPFRNNIKSVHFIDNLIYDISPLSKLKSLEVLTLWNNPLTDIRPLSELTNLFHLNLSDTNVSDISTLNNLKGLKNISLDSTKIKDISSLFQLENPNSISLQFNPQIPKNDIQRLINKFPNAWIAH
jgi:hypothetical protein